MRWIFKGPLSLAAEYSREVRERLPRPILAASRDGTSFRPMRWSTPVSDYKDFGSWHLFSRGEGRWHPPEGEFAYVELELRDLQVNGASD